MNHSNTSILDNPLVLPLRSIREIATEPVLVVAPHPDDETLGCGGAIALLRSQGYTVQILVMSDGTKSHPNSLKFPAPALKALRETETRCAMARFDVPDSNITFLELLDSAVPTPTHSHFSEIVNRCSEYLAKIHPKMVFVPWRFDPHRDHRATWQLIQASLAQMSFHPRVIEYPIWDWDTEQRSMINQNAVKSWRLDISEVLERKQQAIAAYRSQTTNLIDDDPTGFILTPEMLANFNYPWEIYLEETIR